MHLNLRDKYIYYYDVFVIRSSHALFPYIRRKTSLLKKVMPWAMSTVFSQ